MTVCMLSSTNGTIKLQDNVFTTLPFNGISQVTFDPDLWHSDTEDPTKVKPKTLGTFRLTGAVFFDENSGGKVGIQFYKNGNSIVQAYFAASDTGMRAATYTCIVEADADSDYFELGALQNCGSSLTLNNFHFQVELL